MSRPLSRDVSSSEIGLVIYECVSGGGGGGRYITFSLRSEKPLPTAVSSCGEVCFILQDPAEIRASTAEGLKAA